MENQTRRRLLAAGLAGSTLGLLGSRVASATTDTTTPSTDEGSAPATAAATTTTAAPKRPTDEDIPLLQFAHAFELAAQSLYQSALDAGAEDDTLVAVRDNHQAYAEVLLGLLGTQGTQAADEGVLDQFGSDFDSADVAAVAAAGVELENTAVATHTELIGELSGIDGAHLLASILVVEARQAVVLAHLAGDSGDIDALFENDAQPMRATSGG